MANILGILAGSGMIALIILLLMRFAMEIGALEPKRAEQSLQAAGMTLCAEVFLLGGGLILRYVLLHEINWEGNPILFSAPWLTRFEEALILPTWYAPLSGAMAHIGHGIGAILFRQYLLGGMLVSFIFCWAGSRILLTDIRRATDDRMLSLRLLLLWSFFPGTIFCLLPGWFCLISPALAALLHFLPLKRIGRLMLRMPDFGFALIMALEGIASSVLLYMLVTGYFG